MTIKRKPMFPEEKDYDWETIVMMFVMLAVFYCIFKISGS